MPDELLDVLGHDVDLQVDGASGCRVAERRALERLGDERDVEAARRRRGRRSATRRPRRSSPSRRRSAAARARRRRSRRARSRRSRTAATVPVPSTCPCTMWPPRRASARSASSRFTAEPTSSSPSEERRSVSCITSAAKLPSAIAVAVRQTPLTATESPSATSAARRVRDAQPRAVAGRLDAGDGAPILDEPGEHAHHSRSRAVIRTSSPDGSALERDRAHRVGDLLDALALERVARAAPAEQQRGDEQPRLVDLAGVEERARQVRPALEQERGHGQVQLAELVERVGARAPARSRRSRRSRRRPPSRASRWPSGGAARETTTVSGISEASRTSWESSGRRAVESNTTRRGWRVDVRQPRGEPRVVGERGADADDDGVDLGAPVVRELAAAARRRSTASRRRAWRPCRRGSSRT